MAKLTINDVTSGYYSTTALNTAFTAIETAIENTVSRDGTAPNQMAANLDMNSNRITNLPEPINVNEAARLQDVQNSLVGGAANLITSTPYGNISATNIQAAIQEEVDDLAASSGAALVGFLQSGTGAVARTAQDKMRESVSVKDFGAVGDGVTDDTAAIQAAITYWVAKPISVLYFPSGLYLISSSLTATFSSNDFKGKVISGYGAELVSSLASGYMLTVASTATFRYFKLIGLGFRGGASESGCLKLDGGDNGLAQYLYGASISDVHFDSFYGNGLEVVNNVFEASLLNVQSRANPSNITGYCLYFQNGALGAVLSSIDLYACMTVGGLKGVYVKTPASDVKINGGTYLHAQQEGILLENDAGSLVSNVHVENNYEGAVSLATGGAGLRVVGRATIIGAYGTTNSKQKYVVSLYLAAAQTAHIMGGVASGSTVTYAYIDGAAAGNAWIFGPQTYEINGTNVLVNVVGSNIQVGRGNNKGFIQLENNSADFNMTFYRWSGVGTAYSANRIKTSGTALQMLSNTGTADIGSEVYGNPVISMNINNTLGFYNATPVAKQTITGSRGGNAALADLLTKLAATGIITDTTTP